MVDINWCLKIRNGLELVQPSLNMADSYLRMAKESLDVTSNVVSSKIWLASSSYYTMYYSLYALMMKIGVKCEIHTCSIEFMNRFLGEFYSKEDVDSIKSGFGIRNDLQYYPGRLVNDDKLNELRNGCVDFFVKTKEIISRISEVQISRIREEFEKYGN